MYTHGNVPVVLGTTTTAVTIPATGAGDATEVALAAAAGLAVWAVVYLAYTKISGH
jgi:hypothetical protein